PLDMPAMVGRAARLGCEVFQICDDPRVEQLDTAGLHDLRERAELLGVELELGTRTIGREHLGRYLDIAEALGARTLRSMTQSQEVASGSEEAVSELRASLPRLEAAGVSLALETYEQVTTSTLLGIVEELDSPHVGICLDPANCVSALEHPKDVVEACAPRTVNLHVKDFAFARQEGWVGFTYSGAPLGEGLLDLDHELRHVYSGDRAASAVGRAPSAGPARRARAAPPLRPLTRRPTTPPSARLAQPRPHRPPPRDLVSRRPAAPPHPPATPVAPPEGVTDDQQQGTEPPVRQDR